MILKNIINKKYFKNKIRKPFFRVHYTTYFVNMSVLNITNRSSSRHARGVADGINRYALQESIPIACE